MNKQIGGLKLINPEDYRDKSNFQPILDMIDSESAKLTLLSDSSLKGFIFSLEVNPNDSKYMSYQNGNFTDIETNFLLKIAVITPENDIKLDNYGTKTEKFSESPESYLSEARIQSNSWMKSIIGGKPEVCPSVANFSLFDNQNSKNLLEKLLKKQNLIDKNSISRDSSGREKKRRSNVGEDYFQSTPQRSSYRSSDRSLDDKTNTRVLYYLLDRVNNNGYGIGIIVMPKVKNSDTLYQFITDKDNNIRNSTIRSNKINAINAKNDAYAYCLAQIIRLSIFFGVIHLDLHGNNLLVYSKDNSVRSLIIDFGSVSDIMDKTDDDYFTKEQKTYIKGKTGEDVSVQRWITYFSDAFYNINDINENENDTERERKLTLELDFVEEVLKFVTLLDKDRNYKRQFGWYDNIKDNLEIRRKVFKILTTLAPVEDIMPEEVAKMPEEVAKMPQEDDMHEEITKMPQEVTKMPQEDDIMSKEYINKLQSEGFLIDLGKDPNKYYTSISISGGKKKFVLRKTRKTRKTRKIRKH